MTQNESFIIEAKHFVPMEATLRAISIQITYILYIFIVAHKDMSNVLSASGSYTKIASSVIFSSSVLRLFCVYSVITYYLVCLV